MPAVKRYAKADKPKRLRKRKARTEGAFVETLFVPAY